MRRKDFEARVDELEGFRDALSGYERCVPPTTAWYKIGQRYGKEARESILSAAQQQGNEGPSENERLRQEIDRQERESARRKREAERQWTDLQPLAGKAPEQAAYWAREYDTVLARAEAAESREAKLREAIERHRDSGTTSPQYDHNRELWAVLEGESE